MTLLAVVIVGCFLFQLLPGSAFKSPPEYDWAGPNVYVNAIGNASALALAALILLAVT